MAIKSLALAALLLSASSAHAQDSKAPALVLIIGSSVDMASTLYALQQPGTREGNPMLSHGGNAGLIATKAGLTAALVYSLNRLTHHGHPTAAKWLGYSLGAAMSGAAVNNLLVSRSH